MALCKGKDLRCQNEATIRGYCKSCARYEQRYSQDDYEESHGVVVINHIKHKLGSHGLVFRKNTSNVWVRSTKTLEEFTSAQLGPTKKRKKLK